MVPQHPVHPPQLNPGDTIGVCAPASPTTEPGRLDEILAQLRAQGFPIRESTRLRRRTGYLAGSDQERALDLQELFCDREVRAIFALRGGYGSCRMLPHLDWEIIRANPKPFLGYSDITSLHNAIFSRTGLITFHSPNAGDAFKPGNDEPLRKVLMQAVPPEGVTLFAGAEKGFAGKASGRLLGGNLTCLLRLIGTPYAPDFRGALLFLEDINEKAYRIDGDFTHLRLAGVLGQISGLILGRFTQEDGEEKRRISDLFSREVAALGIPCITGAPIGHFTEQVTVPVGAWAEMDADAGELRFYPR